MKKTLIVLVIGVFLTGSACWRKPPETPVVSKRSSVPASTLGSGDVFEVKVYDEGDLSGVYRVSSRGTINFPLVGRLILDGLTSSDAADLIQQRLAEKYIKDPNVNVFIREYHSKKVSIFGEVNKPGTFNYEERMTIIQAISMAGGFTKMASKDGANITRIVDGEEKRYPVPVKSIAQGEAKNFYLEPGDIIYIPETIW